MSNLFVSDCYENNNNVLYIRESLCELFFTPQKSRLTADRHRVGLYLTAPREFFRPASLELCDKIADVIAIGYKYDFFCKKIKPSGLSERYKELLIASLISADLDDDKRFVKSQIQKTENFCGDSSENFCFAIDGFFNFRLPALKDKWGEVAEYVPDYFSLRELNDFISYLLCEKKGKRVIIDGKKVYDRRLNRLKRSTLLGGGECVVVKEAILSGAGEVELKSPPAAEDEKLLREYFGDKVYFS